MFHRQLRNVNLEYTKLDASSPYLWAPDSTTRQATQVWSICVTMDTLVECIHTLKVCLFEWFV